MLLKDIYKNSNYLTDEDMTNSNVIGLANNAIAEINTKVKTDLPFYTEDNYSTTEYDAITASWQLRLIEPYLTFSIFTNDGVDNNTMNFHYNRFLTAISDFKKDGLDYIKNLNDDGTATGYVGNAKKKATVKENIEANPFRGWWL